LDRAALARPQVLVSRQPTHDLASTDRSAFIKSDAFILAFRHNTKCTSFVADIKASSGIEQDRREPVCRDSWTQLLNPKLMEDG